MGTEVSQKVKEGKVVLRCTMEHVSVKVGGYVWKYSSPDSVVRICVLSSQDGRCAGNEMQYETDWSYNCVWEGCGCKSNLNARADKSLL